MRVVYDYGVGGHTPHSSSSPTGTSSIGNDARAATPGQRQEAVIVVSLGRDDQSVRRASPDYEVELSAEARLRDDEVRHHERSHARTLGPYATTPIMYDTARGPDGEVVATGGKIGVDLDPVPGDPRATLQKARVVLNAAHAPGSPSAADMRVAAEAYRVVQQAQDEISSGDHRELGVTSRDE
jgi:hypothetical protein